MQIFAASSFVEIPPDPYVFLLVSIKEFIFSSILFTTLTIFLDLS